MPAPVPDLKLVPTADLVDEACIRFDHCVFHGLIDRNAPSPDSEGTEVFVIRRFGDPLKCAGMAARIQRFILNDLESRTESSDSSLL